MAPESLHRSRRWYFVLGVMFAQTVTLIVLGIIAFQLRDDVGDQQRASRVAEVATCYAAARGRPRLIVILRAISANVQTDPIAREAIRSFIDEYEASTPLLEECDELAGAYGMSPADFPPPTPRGEEGS